MIDIEVKTKLLQYYKSNKYVGDSCFRYGAGLQKSTKEELEWMDRRTRKLLTMYKVLHPKSDVARF